MLNRSLAAMFLLLFSFALLAQPKTEECRRIGSAAWPLAATSNCSGGIKYDDGTVDDGLLVTGPSGSAYFVQKFDLPPGTTSLDQVCTCFSRLSSGAASMPFDVVIYNDNGTGGTPGTLVGTVSATASVPIFPSTGFANVNFSSSGVTLPDNTVFIGARWASSTNVFICADTNSASTRPAYYGTTGTTWTSISAFPSPTPKALFVRADAGSGPTSACTPSTTAMCLNANRFKVEATWQSASSSGVGNVSKLTDDTGYFWFFASTNVEIVVKVLNGCGANARYWVFGAGLTDTRVTLTVTDTKTGSVRQYINPLGTAYAPVQDTSAFATCP